jgi:hypothetical protein
MKNALRRFPLTFASVGFAVIVVAAALIGHVNLIEIPISAINPGGARVRGADFRASAGALTRARVPDRHGNDRGCDDCACSEFDEERAPGARSGDASDTQGEAVVVRDEGARGRG